MRTEILLDLMYLKISALDSSRETLRNLEFLLVKVNVNILPYLLNMPKLRHLKVGDSIQFSRFSNNFDSLKRNSLQTLSFVGIFNLKDEKILKFLPNLCCLECVPLTYRYLDLNFLTQLQSLKVIYERSFGGDYTMINFPMNIKKLLFLIADFLGIQCH